MRKVRPFYKLTGLLLLSLLVVSCGGKKKNSPYAQNALSANGFYNYDAQNVTTVGGLKTALKERLQADLAYLQNGGKQACVYSCPELSLNFLGLPGLGIHCIRVFTAVSGEVHYKTYRYKYASRQNIDSMKGPEVNPPATGSFTSSTIDSLFMALGDNIPTQRAIRSMPGLPRLPGLGTVPTRPYEWFVVPNPMNRLAMGISLGLPAAMAFTPGKQYCLNQM